MDGITPPKALRLSGDPAATPQKTLRLSGDPAATPQKALRLSGDPVKFAAFWPEGVKKTKQRCCVLSVLKEAETPLTAADIYGRIGRDAGSLSTVYRILEMFTQKGTVIRTSLLDSGAAVYELDRHDHRHYAVCLVCRRIFALKNCPMEVFTPDIRDAGFRVLGHKLELQGICGECFLTTRPKGR
ncbi:MAG: transcriptional repressor [Lentisphaerae bacterium]|nr:transcriptional repressor [Lentisphaerota bacterium]